MRVIYQKAPGDLDVLEEADFPKPKPARNEVLVEIRAIGLNPVDVKMRMGIFPSTYPLILGGDFSGVVAAKGDLVREFELGDCVYGLSIGKVSNGSYAEYTCIPQQMVCKMPKSLSFEEAAATPIAYMTAFQALVAHGAFQQDRPLFIAGASGGVGSAALSLAKVYRAGPIFTTAGSETSAEYLIKHFALEDRHIIRYQGLSIEQTAHQLIQQNGGDLFYLALDFVGRKSKELCFQVAGFSGHVATILPEDAQFPVPIWGRGEGPMMKKSLSLHMVNLLAHAMSQDPKDWVFYPTLLEHLANLFDRENLQKPIVEKVGPLSLETVKEAHLRLEEGHTKGKLVMTVDSKGG